MTIQASLDEFKQAISLLKNNESINIANTLQSMYVHRTLVNDAYQDSMKKLRSVLAHYKKAEAKMDKKKADILTGTIQSWAPVVKTYQQALVYPLATTSAVDKIVQSKKNMDMIDKGLNELQIKVAAQSKDSKKASDDLSAVQQRIHVLELAQDLLNFFIINQYNAGGIADYETQKYYDLYMKGGN
jgi:hypothetical protein